MWWRYSQLPAPDSYGIHHWETSPDAAQSFSPWSQLDAPSGIALSSIAVTRNSDGSSQLFATTTEGKVYTRRADAGINNWPPWSLLPDSLGIGPVRWIAAESNTDGRVELLAVDTTGRLWHRYQTTQGADTYSVWAQLPGAALRP
jgi:hypothetical protein